MEAICIDIQDVFLVLLHTAPHLEEDLFDEEEEEEEGTGGAEEEGQDGHQGHVTVWTVTEYQSKSCHVMFHVFCHVVLKCHFVILCSVMSPGESQVENHHSNPPILYGSLYGHRYDLHSIGNKIMNSHNEDLHT